MDIYTVDFETYFSSEYSLTKPEFNTSSYVRHPEFKVQCVAIKKNDEPVVWYRDEHVAVALASIDWSEAAVLCHNTAFDGLILSHHFGIVPKYYFDTLSMARALHANSIGASLDEVAQYYRLGNKVPNVLDSTKGVRDLPPELMTPLGMYCAVDVELTKAIFDKMKPHFPQSELELINLTIRMFTDPVLLVDTRRVEIELQRELDARKALIESAGVPLSVLRSGDGFAAELERRGVHPPTKISPRTGKAAWAFAKSDLAFTRLSEHPDASVRNLVNARLACKSSIRETRAIRFLDAGAKGLRLPVGLKYWGAHTGRWSGGNKMNLQNLPRGGELRKSILAPPGHVIVVCDSSQIEARTLAWLAGQEDVLELFATGQDVYSHMAAEIYGVPLDQVTKDLRFVGKVAVLGLGYGMGATKFQYTLEVGAMGPSVHMTPNEASRIVRTYRRVNGNIVALWSRLERVLAYMAAGRTGEFKCLRFDGHKMYLPNDMYLQYPGLEFDTDPYSGNPTNFRYYDNNDAVRRRLGLEPKTTHGIYGGLFTENVVQALARIIVADQMLEIAKRYRVVTMTHDEVVCLAKEEEADEALEYVIGCMRKRPVWAQELPIDCEGGYDSNYSK